MGKGLHEQYSYCRNISHISAFLWGYVLIWYACGDGSLAFQVRNQLEEDAGGVLAGGYGYVRVPERRDI